MSITIRIVSVHSVCMVSFVSIMSITGVSFDTIDHAAVINFRTISKLLYVDKPFCCYIGPNIIVVYYTYNIDNALYTFYIK